MIYLNYYISTLCGAPPVFSATDICTSLSEFVFADAAQCQVNLSGGVDRFEKWLDDSCPDQKGKQYSSFPILVKSIGKVCDAIHPIVAAGYSITPSPIPAASSLSSSTMLSINIATLFKQYFKQYYFDVNGLRPDESVSFNNFTIAVGSFLFTCYPV